MQTKRERERDNTMFQGAYIIAQVERGEIPDKFIKYPKYFEELRDKIKKVEETKEDMVKLNDELNECIKKQDFEGAIIVRDKINSLK